MSFHQARRHFCLFLAAGLLAACSDRPPETTVTGADTGTAFRAFLAENYALDMEQFPQTASRRAINTDNRAWNPASEAFKQQRRELLEQRLARLSEFDRRQLDAGDDLSWQLYDQELRRSLASDNFRHHKYPIHHYRGVHSQVPSFLINIHTVNSVQDAEDYIARLDAVGPLFDQVIEQMGIAADQGIFLPDWSYPKLVQTASNTISGAPFSAGGDSTLWADIQAKLAALELDQGRREGLLADARRALLESVAPAYRRLIAEAERLAALAPAATGVWKHPDGDAFYRERLRYFTTTELTADEVHDIGLREVDRIKAEMRVIMKQVGFDGTLEEFFVFMREDPRFYYSNDEAGRARYLAEAGAVIDNMRERLPEVFGLFPRADLVVKRVEPFRERSAGKAFYRYPPADGSRPGIYYANLYDMDSMPAYQLEALAYHEGIPGHHMQRAITVELQGIPEFQKYAQFTAFTEGWGLYSEQLPKEMGLYTDPYSDFGRLAMELWRAARLVVDTGLHHKRWTRQQAIDYLVTNTPNSVYDCSRAIERYAVMPGQATAYMIGKLKILELREKAHAALGERFDIREFHDEVLKDGQVPLAVLETKIDAWIAGAGAGA